MKKVQGRNGMMKLELTSEVYKMCNERLFENTSANGVSTFKYLQLKLIVISINLCLLIGCVGETRTTQQNTIEAENLYETAISKMELIEYDSALICLRGAINAGLVGPMSIVSDSNFFPLVDSSKYRVQLRSLLSETARESNAVLIRSNENGESIQVNGRIIDAENGNALNDVHIELVHADFNGSYFTDDTTWNPRLFAYLKSNSDGQFMITTIKPGRYADDDDNLIASHVHFTLNKDGYRPYGSEFTFDDDSIFQIAGNVESIPVAQSLGDKDLNHYQVIISMQKN